MVSNTAQVPSADIVDYLPLLTKLARKMKHGSVTLQIGNKHIALSAANSHCSIEDLVQSAVEDILSRPSDYQEERSAYATYLWSQGAMVMKDAARQFDEPIHVPDRTRRLLDHIFRQHGRDMWRTISAMVTDHGFTYPTAAHAFFGATGNYQDLSGIVGKDERTKHYDILADRLPEDAVTPEDNTYHREVLNACFAGLLSDREQKVLRARFGIGEAEKTLRQLAREMGLTKERIRQIEGEAIYAVRCYLNIHP